MMIGGKKVKFQISAKNTLVVKHDCEIQVENDNNVLIANDIDDISAVEEDGKRKSHSKFSVSTARNRCES